MIHSRFVAGVALSGFILVAAGCQSRDTGKVNDVKAPDGKISVSELTAYCPKVSLREGTAYYDTYAKGGDGDKSKILYQASISDVTRSCTRAAGQLTINVAVAGKVVPGPLGQAGTITMPIRVVVMRGDAVLYTQLHKYNVAIGSVSEATQFVFNDPNATVPDPTARDLQIFAGFDEGPPKAKKPDADG